MNVKLSDEEMANLLESAKSTNPQDLLARAWQGIEEGPDSELLRDSLMNSASQIPDLQVTLDRLTRPEQAVLDFSIFGESVVGHSAFAGEIGRLVSRVSESVKEIAKSISGLARLGERLLVTAPMPGSVRFVFSVAPETRIQGHENIVRGETLAIETSALTKLLLLMDQAETSSTLLDQSIQNLRQPARDAVKSLAKSITKNEWNIVGNLHLPSGERTQLNLTVEGGDRLVDALEEHPVDRTTILVSGVIDGWTWSRRSMSFLPDSGPRFDALVDDLDLEATVGSLHSIRGLQVDAEFEVLIVSLAGNLNLKRKSHKLIAIAPRPIQAELS